MSGLWGRDVLDDGVALPPPTTSHPPREAVAPDQDPGAPRRHRRSYRLTTSPSRPGRPTSATTLASLRARAQGRSRMSLGWSAKLSHLERRSVRGAGDDGGFGASPLGRRAEGWAQAVVAQMDAAHPKAWTELACELRVSPARLWRAVALWMLARDPAGMVPFLRYTHAAPYPPATWVADSLSYLAHHFRRSSGAQRDGAMQELARVFIELTDRTPRQRFSFQNSFARLLIPHCPKEQLEAVYRAIKDNEVEQRGYTFLHFATYFAKNDGFPLALDALLTARNIGIDINRFPFLSTCSTIIRSCVNQPNGLRRCLHVVSRLVDMGVRLNGPLCDIIMLNAVEAGDVQTAFSIYRSLVAQGLRPTESTFAVLLKGCRMNIGDPALLNEMIRDAIRHVRVRESPVIATSILHCLALHHSQHHPETALHTLTNAYAQFFDLTPLHQLGLPIPIPLQTAPSAPHVMPPTPHAITFMLGASIQHLQLRAHWLPVLAAIYSRWRAHIAIGTPHLTPLAATTHMPNTFLTGFIASCRGLTHAAAVIRDMQRGPPPTTCAPSVQTWTIFLHGFTRHGLVRLAEQTLAYMRARGLAPNTVTWHTLITGYARAEDVAGAADALARAEARGLRWNAWTHAALRTVRRRHRFREVLARRRVARRLDFSEELKSGLVERLGGGREEEGGDA